MRKGALKGPDGVEVLIARVVQAESDARIAVDQCQQQAANIIAAAQSAALRVAERTEQRIIVLQRRMAADAQARLDAIGAEAVALAAEAPDTAAFISHVDNAVATVADELVGRTPKDSLMEYAQARLQARQGERPSETLWLQLAATKELEPLLETAHGSHFRRWVAGIDVYDRHCTISS